MLATLYYIHDPMCGWCWGYRPVWERLQQKLPEQIAVEYVLGGLAPDTDLPMPEQMQRDIQAIWCSIREKLGTEFNFEFWTNNTPSRSTYLSCRAVIVATEMGHGKAMINAIQQAYYLRAMNPSERVVLQQLAAELASQGLDLDPTRFATELESVRTNQELQRQIALAKSLTNRGFPSLVLEHDGRHEPIEHDYLDHRHTLKLILDLLGT